MKPICVPCQRFYRPKRNGFYFREGMPIGNQVPAGKEADDRWTDYKLWVGDLWECEGCGHQTVAGVPVRPIGEHYESDFQERVKALDATFRVNDC